MGAFAVTILQSLPGLIAAGVDIAELINGANARIKVGQDNGVGPTPADWDWLNAEIKALQEQLHAPGT